MVIVQKFGGSSLADEKRIMAAAKRAAGAADRGEQVVVVVSAQGDTTDELIARAERLSAAPSRREMDAFLSAGEQMSAALMAMAIGALGHRAVSLTGPQAGICTDTAHGNARITLVDTRRLERELDAGKVVVVAGFQGLSPFGDITTLGRGGSDTTAVALAAWLKANMCRIYTDVEGVYDRDPRIFPDARKFAAIGYDEMLALIDRGAQVLHRPCVELAKQHKVSIQVLSSFRSGAGTMVKEQ